MKSIDGKTMRCESVVKSQQTTRDVRHSLFIVHPVNSYQFEGERILKFQFQF